MGNAPKLEGKIKEKVEHWFAAEGDKFIICTKEFCQGNRSALRPLMDLLRDLAVYVFVYDGFTLRDDLLEDLEYGIFELIGQYTSTPGGDKLLEAIQHTIIQHVTDIFVDAKRHWNLNNFKITESIEELDPLCGLFESHVESGAAIDGKTPENANAQAKRALEILADFAQRKFRGDKNRKIALKILTNPEKVTDFSWMAELADTSVGSAKVTLTRIKQTLARNFDFKRLDDELIITQVRGFQK